MVAIAFPVPARAGAPSPAGTARHRRTSPRSPAATSPATFRRRRFVVAVVASGVLVVGWFGLARLGGGSLSTSEPPSLRVQPIAQAVHVVQPGDTLWEIARTLDPEGDPRRTVHLIVERRGSGPLHAGERIALPQ